MRTSYLLLPCFLISFSLSAQYMEAGVQLGLSNYAGELSEQNFKSEGFGSLMGVFGRYNFTKYLSAKVSLAKGTISGSDEFAKSPEIKMRNLSFRSEVIELSFTGECNLSPFNIRANQTGVPYLFAGFGIAHFNPQAQMRGSWYNLQPLRTEGVKYTRTTLVVPFGVGMKFNISYKVNFGFEFGARKTFTDYLDDVSRDYIDVVETRKIQPTVAALAYRSPELTGSTGENPVGLERGDRNNKDWYMFGAVTVSINLTDKYGLDFDKKYEVFKDHLKKPKEEKPIAEKTEHEPVVKPAKKKHAFRLFRKKKYMEPFVKKIVD